MPDSRPIVLLDVNASQLFLAFAVLANRLVLAYPLRIVNDRGHCEIAGSGLPQRLIVTGYRRESEFLVVPVRVNYDPIEGSAGYCEHIKIDG